MSREKVELIRRGYELFNAGEIDAWLALFHPEIELAVSGVFPGFDPVYRGHGGVRHFYDSLLEAWEAFRADVADIAAEGDWVAVELTLHAKGRGSGVPVQLAFHHAFLFSEDGLVRRWASFPTRSEALEAVGLSE